MAFAGAALITPDKYPRYKGYIPISWMTENADIKRGFDIYWDCIIACKASIGYTSAQYATPADPPANKIWNEDAFHDVPTEKFWLWFIVRKVLFMSS